jgi:hypothetical protein
MKDFITMDLRTKKYTMIEKIMHLDEKAVEKLEGLLSELLGENSLAYYNQELDQAGQAIDAGEYISHGEAIKRIREWRGK